MYLFIFSGILYIEFTMRALIRILHIEFYM
jgi:hypothetical protein